MVELYQDTLVDLLLPKNAKRLKLEIKKDSKVFFFFTELMIPISAVFRFPMNRSLLFVIKQV